MTDEGRTPRRRQAVYWIVGIGLTVALFLGRNVDWLGSADLHTVMEVEQTHEWAVSRSYMTLETPARLGHHEDSPVAIVAE